MDRDISHLFPYHRCDLLVPLTIPTGFYSVTRHDSCCCAVCSPPPTIDCVRKAFIYFLQHPFYFSPDQLKSPTARYLSHRYSSLEGPHSIRGEIREAIIDIGIVETPVCVPVPHYRLPSTIPYFSALKGFPMHRAVSTRSRSPTIPSSFPP